MFIYITLTRLSIYINTFYLYNIINIMYTYTLWYMCHMFTHTHTHTSEKGCVGGVIVLLLSRGSSLCLPPHTSENHYTKEIL